METWKVTIPGLLPGLNEYIDAERAVKGKYKAAAMKKQAENVIGFMVKTQLRGVRFDRPVIIHYRWIEPNRRRDKDNVAFAKKFIQDSLVHAGVLVNDGWNQIEGFTDDFAVDPKNPRVEVTTTRSPMTSKAAPASTMRSRRSTLPPSKTPCPTPGPVLCSPIGCGSRNRR